MERAARAWDAFTADPRQVFGIAVAGCFIAASTIIGLVFAWDMARTMPLALTGALMLIIFAAEIYKSIYILMTWRSGRFASGLIGVPILIAACAYSITANNKTMEKYFGRDEWHAVSESPAYKSAKRESGTLEERLKPLKDARVTGTIKAELDGKLATDGLGDCKEMATRTQYAVCPKVALLRAELAGAMERDRLESLLAQAMTKLAGIEDPGAQQKGHLGLVAGALAEAGITVTTREELLGFVIAFLIEFGSLFAPAVLIGGAHPTRAMERRVFPDHIRDTAKMLPPIIDAEPISSPREYGDARINQIAAFFDVRCERNRGGALSATLAWQEFEKWCAEKSVKPLMKRNQFWKYAADELKLPREKTSSEHGTGVHYMNLVLKPPRRSLAGLVQVWPRGGATASAS